MSTQLTYATYTVNTARVLDTAIRYGLDGDPLKGASLLAGTFGLSPTLALAIIHHRVRVRTQGNQLVVE